jgi:copper transport protein
VAGLLAVFGATGVALAAPALAHAELVSADPTDGQRLASAPRAVTLIFSENVSIDTGYLRVLNAAGQRVDAGSPTHPGGDGHKVSVPVKSGLPNAGYLVSWRVVSADSHPIGGAYSFVVGNGTPLDAQGGGVDPGAANSQIRSTFTVVRFLGFFGLVLLGGAVFLAACWPAGRTRARPRAVIWAGWGLTAWAAVLGGLLEGPYGAGTGPSTLLNGALLRATLHSDYGRMISTRLVLLAVLAVLLAKLLAESASPPWLEDATTLTGLGVLATYAGAGHAATGTQPALTVFADTAHLAAMSAWLGGLVMIAFSLPSAGTALARPLARFSRLAMYCVGTLVVTGTYRSWRDIGSWGALFHTAYGRIVLVKICLLAVLLVLGNASRLFVRRLAAGGGPEPSTVDLPAVEEAGVAASSRRTLVPVGGSGGADIPTGIGEPDDAPPDEPAEPDEPEVPIGVLRRSVLAELVVAAVVLGFTAVLVSEPPGRSTYVAPSSGSVALANKDRAEITVTPALAGPNTLELTVLNPSGAAVEVQGAEAYARLPGSQYDRLPVSLVKAGTGRYTATAVSLPASGRWEINLSIRVSQFDAYTAVVPVTVH